MIRLFARGEWRLTPLVQADVAARRECLMWRAAQQVQASVAAPSLPLVPQRGTKCPCHICHKSARRSDLDDRKLDNRLHQQCSWFVLFCF